jgi:hypothetical protein
MQIALDKVVTWVEQLCVTINREKTTGTLFTLSPKIQPGKILLKVALSTIKQTNKHHISVFFFQTK